MTIISKKNEDDKTDYFSELINIIIYDYRFFPNFNHSLNIDTILFFSSNTIL